MSRSLINTSLFMNKINEDSYEKVDDQEDLYIIKSENKNYYLYRQRLIDTVKDLYPYAHVQISKLEKDQKQLLENTMKATKLLYHSNVLKNLIVDDIQEIFKDIKNPTPGSVCAFFITCFNHDDFKGPLGCHPKALSFGCDTCEDTILSYNYGFIPINRHHTNHAYIYIDCKFTNFTRKDIQKLKDDGIQKVTLIYGNKNGTYQEITYQMSLDKLPVSKNTTTASTSTIVLLIIIILIMLGLLFVYGNGYLEEFIL